MACCLTKYFDYLLSNESLYYIPSGSLFSLLIFILYLEISPKLGNIWYRYSDDGKRHINLPSLYNFIKQPFINLRFWSYNMLDLNIITFVGISTGLYVIIRRSIDFLI